MRLLIKGGRVINPNTNLDGIRDILVLDGRVARIEENIGDEVDQVIEANNLWVTPGLIDLHVHLREPGFEHKETIETGSRSAARGGFTTICCMPNVKPVMDSKPVIELVKNTAREKALVHVLPIGSITKGLEGKELAPIEEMVEAGICAISDDGKTVQNPHLMREGMKRARDFNIPIFSHCEDEALLNGGVMNQGKTCEALGLRGILSEVEDVIISRDVILARGTGARLHICHLSTSLGVDLIRFGRSLGVDVTAEVCPHHFTLTDEEVGSLDTNMKMNPPLRGEGDVLALKEGLRDGTIEVIATDHAPHHKDDKNLPFSQAAFGIVGLETALPLGITELVEKGWLTPMKFIEKLTINPARILGIDKGDIGVGKIADITIIDPAAAYKIDVNTFASKGKNSPFHNRPVRGRVEYTLVHGKVVYDRKSERG